MGQYSIRQLELVSGIKAHTIRIWEKRYNLFTPYRTDSNIRKYTDEDLRLLLNVVFLLHHGFKISKIAQKKHEELNNLVRQQNGIPLDNSINFEMLLFDIISFNEMSIRIFLGKAIDELGMEEAYNKILTPLLQRIGILWQSGMIFPAHEHLVSNLIKQQLIYQTTILPEPEVNQRPFIFFLPEGELHEISLLYYNFLTRKNGIGSIYLGQSTPLNDVLSLSDKVSPAAIYTSITTSLVNLNLDDFFRSLNKKFPESYIFASGTIIAKEKENLPGFVIQINATDQFLKHLTKFLQKSK